MPRPWIVVDPGHGGADPGAVAHGSRESDLNLALARRFRDLALSRSFDVELLRDADVFVSLKARTEMANAIRPAAVLSFHNNAASTPAASGFEVWTSRGETEADSLASRIFDELELTLPYAGRPEYDDGDPDREANFYILRKTAAPAVLIEFGFVTCQKDLAHLETSQAQLDIARALGDAVEGWLAEQG